MIEHWLVVGLLVFVAVLGCVSLTVLGVLVHRASRIEGVSAATFLEVRKILRDAR